MNESNIPPLASSRELTYDELRPYLLDPREDYPEPFYMLEFNGVPFSTLGGIQAISGQKKNGKSFVLTQLMAVILGHDSQRVELYLPGLKVPKRTLEHLGHEPRVLYVDTEMEKLNSAKVLRRVHWLCGWDMKAPQDRFNVLWLRTVEADKDEKGEVTMKAYRKRFMLIMSAINLLEPDVVFIDGIRDIIGNFNDNEESAALVNELQLLAQNKDICIWNALHLNPRPGNDDDSKMRGHLGTELGNKVSDTLVSVKEKKNGEVSFTVKQQDARGKDLDDWKFEVTDDAGALGIPKIISGGIPADKPKVVPDSTEDITSWIEKADKTYEWPMSRKEFKKRVFGEIGGQKNKDKQDADLQVAFNLKLIQDSAIKKNGYHMIMPADELPF